MATPTLQSRSDCGAEPAVRPARASELPALLDWLDDGLRGGRRGRLAAEHPLTLAPARPQDHRLVAAEGRLLSHAMLSEVRARTPAGVLRLGLIGQVLTAPEARRRGLASRCVEACAAELASRGIGLALLWSEHRDLYRRLGFEPAGQERRLDLAAGTPIPSDPGFEVGAPRPGEWATLEALHGARAVGSERAAGSLKRLCEAPDTRLRVARRGGAPRAYAALGRGDDFPGVVHEWAGTPPAVLACLAALAREQPALSVLLGPEAAGESLAQPLLRAGARLHTQSFALARVLDPGGLWRALVPDAAAPRLEAAAGRLQLRGARRSVALSHAELLALLFGSAPPRRLLASLAPGEAAALRAALPWPLYLWGFDSL